MERLWWTIKDCFSRGKYEIVITRKLLDGRHRHEVVKYAFRIDAEDFANSIKAWDWIASIEIWRNDIRIKKVKGRL